MKKMIQDDIQRSIQGLSSTFGSLKGKVILITGGTGFVGAWVARSLVWLNDELNFDCSIIILTRNPKKLEELDPDLYGRSDISFIKSDIRSLHDLPQDINYIIHSAANPDNRVHMSDPVNTMDVIAIGTKAIMDAASRLSDIKGIVYLSSGQVYGDAPGNGAAISENSQGYLLKKGINSIYPEAKRYSEALCLAYRSLYKLPVTIVRPFSFIGPYQELNKPWAINSFMQEALNGQPIRILGNGKPKRSYLYATDMAAWLLAILANGKDGEVYNLGSSEEVSLLEVANEINSIISIPVDIIVKNNNTLESNFIPSLDYIHTQLGVKENFTFKEALLHTIKWNVNKQGSNDE
ncbi:NAD-dependent epimerase/dehydratase family protein [Thiomicrorhabdus arctica]|uniref:NAD-dependent epimerase/dehydratase family protein n=1 Tax=Thiomicrorhabdus arctica TaxID=131540 RepID=UPI00037F7243|nr:NAD-dependent epimerase/dehydratase family protein [Thiomicrorhabdus arctica]